MIEVQERYPGFPGHPWVEITNVWQQISLGDIKKYRFRFHGKLVEDRKYLNAYMEKEIVYAKLQGRSIHPRLMNNEYKR